jgi:hypothetical protein
MILHNKRYMAPQLSVFSAFLNGFFAPFLFRGIQALNDMNNDFLQKKKMEED